MIRGARIRTLEPARPWAEAVAIRDGAIVAVGDDREVAGHVGAATETIDGGGLALVPGLTDAHIHPVWGAELAVGAELNGLTTLAAVRDALAAEAARTPAGEWVRGWGLDTAVFGTAAVSGAALADAVAGRPALVLCYDLHTAVATPAALAAAGVDGPRAFADASEVVCDGAGRPTGELREPSAYRLVLAAAPGMTGEGLRRRVAAVLRDLAAVGLTGGHAMDGSPEALDLYARLEQDGELCQRVVVPFWQPPAVSDEQIEAQLPLRDAHGRRWRAGVAKLFVDGVIETGTAWLGEPDAHGDGLTPYWPDPGRYADVVARFARAGFQCVSHAIGDRAVRAALDAYAAAGARPANGAPHRIEHLEVLGDRDVARVAAEGVVASMQPLYMQWRRADQSDPWSARLGRARVAQGYRTRDLLDAGAQLALGSDWPVAPVDPRVGMAWARLRRAPGERDAPVLEPHQRLTGLEALQGYTTWAAAAVGEHDRRGRVAVGCAADLTAFAADPVELPADELPDLPVRLTVVDGEVVHRDTEEK